MSYAILVRAKVRKLSTVTFFPPWRLSLGGFSCQQAALRRRVVSVMYDVRCLHSNILDALSGGCTPTHQK